MSQSCLRVSLYHVHSSFWSFTPFSLLTRPVSALYQFFHLSPSIWMGLLNPSQAFERSLLLSNFLRLLTLSGILLSFISLFRLASLFALFNDRHDNVVFQNYKSSYFPYCRGVAQGSILSPFLFFHQRSPCIPTFFRQQLSLC